MWLLARNVHTSTSRTNLSLKQLKPLVQRCGCNSLLRKPRSLASFDILTLSLCCDTLMTDRFIFITFDLVSVSTTRSTLAAKESIRAATVKVVCAFELLNAAAEYLTTAYLLALTAQTLQPISMSPVSIYRDNLQQAS